MLEGCWVLMNWIVGWDGDLGCRGCLLIFRICWWVLWEVWGFLWRWEEWCDCILLCFLSLCICLCWWVFLSCWKCWLRSWWCLGLEWKCMWMLCRVSWRVCWLILLIDDWGVGWSVEGRCVCGMVGGYFILFYWYGGFVLCCVVLFVFCFGF